MEVNPKDLYSPSGNRLAGNPPASFGVAPAGAVAACGVALEGAAGVRILETPTPCFVMTALVGGPGCRGSKLPDPGCKEGGLDADGIDDTSSKEGGLDVDGIDDTSSGEGGLDVDDIGDTSHIGMLSGSLGSMLLLGEGESVGNFSTTNPLPPASLPGTGGQGKLSIEGGLDAEGIDDTSSKEGGLDADGIGDTSSGEGGLDVDGVGDTSSAGMLSGSLGIMLLEGGLDADRIDDTSSKEGGLDADGDTSSGEGEFDVDGVGDTSSIGILSGSLEIMLLLSEGESVGNSSTTNPLSLSVWFIS